MCILQRARMRMRSSLPLRRYQLVEQRMRPFGLSTTITTTATVLRSCLLLRLEPFEGREEVLPCLMLHA